MCFKIYLDARDKNLRNGTLINIFRLNPMPLILSLKF